MQSDAFTLILVRHAEAAAVSDAVRSDAERPLTARGMEDASAVGRFLARIDRPPALILTSPLYRAIQTGELLARAYDSSLPRIVCQALQPGFRNEDFIDELVALRRVGHDSVLAVGHQPDVGVLINFLVAASAPTSVAMSPGTAARMVLRLSGGRPEGVLQWIFPPSAARAVLSSTSQRCQEP
jgi:phosphohistidine phosphatase